MEPAIMEAIHQADRRRETSSTQEAAETERFVSDFVKKTTTTAGKKDKRLNATKCIIQHPKNSHFIGPLLWFNSSPVQLSLQWLSWPRVVKQQQDDSKCFTLNIKRH